MIDYSPLEFTRRVMSWKKMDEPDVNKPRLVRNPEHEKYGSTIAGSRWFKAQPIIREVRVVPYRQHWLCPIDGGEMEFTGKIWPTGNPGYHHQCRICGFQAAITGGEFPRIVYREET